MAYASGTANSAADLLLAVQNACVAAGWTLSGTVLHKGACYMQVQAAGAYLTVLGGRGIDVSNNLTGIATALPCRIGDTIKGLAVTWPATYSIHINAVPDEVVVLVNFGVVYYQWVAFGSSPSATLAAPATGNWFAGTGNTAGKSYIRCGVNDYGSYGAGTSAAPFWSYPGDAAYQNYATSAFDHGMENQSCYAIARQPAENLLLASPNAWNGEATLIPIQVITARPSSFWSLVGELAHARYLRIDNLDAGQIITLGADRWRVYPFYRKNSAVRNGGDDLDHTGTLGWAIRYDGP